MLCYSCSRSFKVIDVRENNSIARRQRTMGGSIDWQGLWNRSGHQTPTKTLKFLRMHPYVQFLPYLSKGKMERGQCTALCIWRTRTRKRMRTRTRTLCIRRTLSRHVTIGTPMVIFAVLTVFWLVLTIGTLLLHCWYRLGRHVTIGTPMSFLLFYCLLTVFDDWYTVGTLLVQSW